MGAYLWHILIFFADTTLWKRRLKREEQVDVVFISNFRDENERKKYMLRSQRASDFIDGVRINMGDVYGRLKIINTDTQELLTTTGRRKAKQQFISATQWAVNNGAKVVLLSASTKRLFGRNAKELKEKFPNIIFTIGDNGTAHLLIEDTVNAIKRYNISKEHGRVVVLGVSGILGEAVVEFLSSQKYDVIGVGDNTTRLQLIQKKYAIEISESIETLRNIDIVIACTHKKKMQLNTELIQKVKVKNRKLIVVDVAEPSNLLRDEYLKCQNLVIRQDAGNAYSKQIKYTLGSLSYGKITLSKGIAFGCFTEAMAVAWAIKSNQYMDRNWFEVNHSNIKFISKLFREIGVITPIPKCFGRDIEPY